MVIAPVAQAAAGRVASLRHWRLLTASIACCAAVVLVTQEISSTGDYAVRHAVAGDNPAPAITALIHGQLSQMVRLQPLMGLVSILLRAPVASVASAAGSSELVCYRLGAIVCMLPAALLCAWLIARPPREQTGAAKHALDIAGAVIVAAVILAGPITRRALISGHPEELLASVLATAAVVFAARGRGSAAGILLGLAFGTKQWALFAVAPVLLALPHERLRAMAWATGVAALMSTPALADPSAFSTVGRQVGATHAANLFSLWWPVGLPHVHVDGVAPRYVRVLPLGLDRTGASAIVLLGAMGTVTGLAALATRTRRRAPHPLALLAILALLRCAADPLPLEYYFLPALVALGAWEILVLERLPLATLLALAGVMAAFGIGLHRLNVDVLNVFVIAGTLALCAHAACTRNTPRAAWQP